MAADPTRRRVLTASALAAVTAAAGAGCAPGHPWPWANPPRPAPDVAVLQAAITAERGVIATYSAVISAVPALATTAAPLLDQHRAHLTQLRQRLVVPAGAPPSPRATGRTRGAAPPVPAGRSAALAYLRAAEHGQAAFLLRSLATPMTPSLAQLLASIAASEVTHEALLLRPAGGRR